MRMKPSITKEDKLSNYGATYYCLNRKCPTRPKFDINFGEHKIIQGFMQPKEYDCPQCGVKSVQINKWNTVELDIEEHLDMYPEDTFTGILLREDLQRELKGERSIFFKFSSDDLEHYKKNHTK